MKRLFDHTWALNTRRGSIEILQKLIKREIREKYILSYTVVINFRTMLI